MRHPWAPNVTEVAQPCPGAAVGPCYLMYYVGHSGRFGVNCVAVATASAPGGPFTDHGPLAGVATDAVGRPVGCGGDGGYGLIDPSLFIDPVSGQGYLYVSVSYVCATGATSCGRRAGRLAPTISMIPLSSDLLSAAGPRVALFGATAGTWEGLGAPAPTVEAPAVVLHNGTYYLLFSGGSWQVAYGMGYATAPSPAGPFTPVPGRILEATGAVHAPGGADAPVVGPHGGLWLIYHARTGGLGAPRTLWIDPLSWQPVPGQPDAPQIGGPTSAPQTTVP